MFLGSRKSLVLAGGVLLGKNREKIGVRGKNRGQEPLFAEEK